MPPVLFYVGQSNPKSANPIPANRVYMLNQNKILTGVIVGLVLPALGAVLIFHIFKVLAMLGGASGEGFTPNFRERTSIVIALALNLIPMNMFRNRRWDKAMRGVVIVTTILAFAWVGHYSLKLF